MTDRRLEPTGMVVDYLCVIGAERPTWSVASSASVPLDLSGIPGDRHYGPTRTVRRFQSPELAGRDVANDRQLIIAQASDMAAIACAMGLPVEEIERRGGTSIERFMAEQLAVNILVTSPRRDELITLAVSGLVLVLGNDAKTAPAMKLSEYSRPCNQPVTRLVASLARLGLAPTTSVEQLRTSFKHAARTGRGWLGAVFAAGTVSVGGKVSSYPLLHPRPANET